MTQQRLSQEVETALDMHIDSIAHQLGGLPAKLVCAARKWRETPEASLGEVILRTSAPDELRAIEAQVGTAGAWQSHRLPVLAIWQFLAADGAIRPDLCVAATWLWYQNIVRETMRGVRKHRREDRVRGKMGGGAGAFWAPRSLTCVGCSRDRNGRRMLVSCTSIHPPPRAAWYA